MLTTVYALLFYAAAIAMVAGLALRIVEYALVPAPLKIPTPPAPATRRGVAFRLLREAVVFESLFKSNKWIWAFGWVFHASLVVALSRHLRYFTEPVWGFVALVQPFGIYAGFAMTATLGALWARRILMSRVRYISTPSDHLMLALLIGIASSGLTMKFFSHTDIVALKAFFLGLIYFDWHPLPSDPVLLVHLGLVAGLMAIFPFSKLLHTPGIFFSPTRNQVDNARERRHLARWAANFEIGVGAGGNG